MKKKLKMKEEDEKEDRKDRQTEREMICFSQISSAMVFGKSVFNLDVNR